MKSRTIGSSGSKVFSGKESFRSIFIASDREWSQTTALRLAFTPFVTEKRFGVSRGFFGFRIVRYAVEPPNRRNNQALASRRSDSTVDFDIPKAWATSQADISQKNLRLTTAALRG